MGPGPASRATVPVMTKMPAPMEAPTPRRMRSRRERRRRRWSAAAAEEFVAAGVLERRAAARRAENQAAVPTVGRRSLSGALIFAGGSEDWSPAD